MPGQGIFDGQQWGTGQRAERELLLAPVVDQLAQLFHFLGASSSSISGQPFNGRELEGRVWSTHEVLGVLDNSQNRIPRELRVHNQEEAVE